MVLTVPPGGTFAVVESISTAPARCAVAPRSGKRQQARGPRCGQAAPARCFPTFPDPGPWGDGKLPAATGNAPGFAALLHLSQPCSVGHRAIADPALSDRDCQSTESTAPEGCERTRFMYRHAADATPDSRRDRASTPRKMTPSHRRPLAIYTQAWGSVAIENVRDFMQCNQLITQLSRNGTGAT